MEEVKQEAISVREWEECGSCLYDSKITPMQGWEDEGMIWGKHSSSSFLRQYNGGPCGVLMSIQAEYLVQYLFLSSESNSISDLLSEEENDISSSSSFSVSGSIMSEKKKLCWANAMATMLVRASSNNNVILLVLRTNRTSRNTESSSIWTNPANFEKITLSDPSKVAQILLQHPTLMSQYTQPGGVLLFAMAMVWTRGKINILQDMDDKTVLITPPFGHVSQELLNLCLTGRAVSNVWDDGHVVGLGGIASNGHVGYLTLLEALRYVQVGSFYKFPQYPIWVIASSTHFTLLFGSSTDILKESTSDQLLITCKREFDKYAAGSQYDGMIETKHLSQLLATFQPQLQSYCEKNNNTYSSLVETLHATLEMPGTNLILWDEFWKTCSRLFMGASLESVLHVPPPSSQITTIGTSERPKTDEELARELQAQFDAELNNNGATSQPTMDYINNDHSGYDAEVSQLTLNNNNNNTNDGNEQITSFRHDNQNTTTSSSSTCGSTFTLYHYNALRGGELSTMEITRLSAEELVGISSQQQLGGSSTRGDLEDVINTKWPSCKITRKNNNYSKPPSID
uniref:Deubiquitinating enzyme MINDY-3/4 conserved domain-containing protein n=1 Tax=Eucampia antarctica TaxID=49252 RepID=A0A7S2WB12_9STRA|mmetsp:Transcript_25345/g.24294  ORF Transcript_25345/g.24294 Transcript_25345/m.24294 type:complete len:571 (+) Transcript_25345:141-1853(+)|eukprot:CAMPEP_0197826148 /NCGR_PEP_ID=MMETSP1437-20131217/3144_1 /TAXON_ID=49252 ORGANISM="Eucampia antarctica, Strain CCMP1452" /NCGR_SAMPLE_ID=MMETSP1437 /ASSEMBLY_ACC=CAM_ASM_001096 /LENGTH=570 /DNA_ID=CAMNT_0043426459 /DNA_START=96 /DNA_END=1808 /DNA_ORIENTATION=-